jgi:hypothetical protein
MVSERVSQPYNTLDKHKKKKKKLILRNSVRTHSPLPQLSPDALFSACKCIINAAPSGTWSQATNGIYKAARLQSFVPAGCPTGFSDFINNEFVDARAFCQFWHYW